ncbi:hypothetical protein [Gilliamella sp. Pas-s25]|uniref:hypothetical protein n=1 Tax=Gilliamella sp. Pas-s25 TaxID=2687310 RepID=UPI00135ED924|nr:hypothetical protein [Gilliamella sp. Pas-s25]MWP62273.1 hypothetical protein [Gilliamella sp. Pas-s25]
MKYNYGQLTWQTYALNLSNNRVRWFFIFFSFISSKLSTELFAKIPLSLAALLLLPYSQCSQSLVAHTSQVIQGSAPYLTFDGGQTKVTTIDALLFITLPDGTTVTPSTNTSSATNPIRLINESNLSNIGMLVPPSTNSIGLDALIRAPYNYWGDDDGDGQGTNGVTATGNLSVSFTDKNGSTVSRSDTLDICSAPYKVTLSSTDGNLTTQYGIPNSRNFGGSTVTYYIYPNAQSKVCYARPNLYYGENEAAGPASIWNSDNGFLTQSINPSSYGLNFPTTGADGLYFDLDIGGVDASQLTWSPVTHGGIMATVSWTQPRSDSFTSMWGVTEYDSWIDDKSQYVTRVTLNGPRASDAQIRLDNPSPLRRPILPQTFELEGRDRSGHVVIKYGFVLQKWFINRGHKLRTYSEQSSWCSSLGYRLSQVRDLTNSKCGKDKWFPCLEGIEGATPSSSGNYFQRQIGAGFLTEWGYLSYYPDEVFQTNSFCVDSDYGSKVMISSEYYEVSYIDTFDEHSVICTAP